jgi:light-regulated signal transduction histidine kinase (bacteriophytochrome)
MLQEKKLMSANLSLGKEIEERRANEEKVRLLNQQLIQNNTELKAINEELDRFAYVASHDLQEPLRKILIFSDVINTRLEGKVDAEVQNALNKISKASDRMQQLINDLLKFSRHASNVDDFNEIDLNEMVRDIVSDMEHTIQERNAQVNLEALPRIWGIPSQIHQLFQNLISNSIKFCKADCKPAIHLWSEPMDNNVIPNLNDEMRKQVFHKIYIQDNGIGFDQKYAQDIFVVFKRLHSYHEFEGTGIGLSICKKIVEKHNGFITAESEPDKGSTFVIMLPENAPEHEGVEGARKAVLAK